MIAAIEIFDVVVLDNNTDAVLRVIGFQKIDGELNAIVINESKTYQWCLEETAVPMRYLRLK